MLRFGGEWLEHKDKLYKSDKHFYRVFNSWFNGSKKEAVLYLRHNFDFMPMMDAKKLIVNTVSEYDESYIKGRLAYIEEQSPESII